MTRRMTAPRKAEAAMADAEAIFRFSTERAVCVCSAEDREDIWLPLSLVEVSAGPKGLVRGATVTIHGPEWLLIERGLV